MASERGLQSLFAPVHVPSFNAYSQAVFSDLHTCHTAKKGYQIHVCNNGLCREIKTTYHRCGNRHCPNCGNMKRDAWIEDRMSELLPTAYYHIVFTLPHELNPLVMGNRKLLLGELFNSASQCLLNHGNNEDFLGAQPGITMVLHTWGQDLSFHPHVHCIVTGGGYKEGLWVQPKRKNNRFLFPVKSLSKMYKAMFMKALEGNTQLKWGTTDRAKVMKDIRHKNWNVYAKAPFGGPAQVVEYLGRYTHKIAITRHRIVEVTDEQVKFRYKDYADGNKGKEMALTHTEFVRRFEQHILPRGFVKIRHHGFLRCRNKHGRMATIRQSLGLEKAMPRVHVPVAIRMLEKYGTDIRQCPRCRTGTLLLLKDSRAEGRAQRKKKQKHSFRPAPV